MLNVTVLIDGYYLGRPSGYGRYIYELIRAVGSNAEGFNFLVSIPEGVDPNVLHSYPAVRYLRSPRVVFPVWEQMLIPVVAIRNRVDLIHFPYNTRSYFTFGLPTVTTVHDLTFFRQDLPRDFKSALIHFYMRLAFRSGTRASDKVLAVSDTTRAVVESTGVTADRIYNTVDGFVDANAPPPRAALERPFFLHRGSYGALHRNTDRIIQAFLSTPALTDKYSLIILGVPDGANVWKTTDQPVLYLKHVSDAELALLYSQSTALIAASILEGFCLPIIEAFGFGAPVISSNIDPMSEIAGDAALLVDPYSLEDIAGAMLKIACDPILAKQLVERGRLRRRVFSSDRMCAELLDAYRATIGLGQSRLASEPDASDADEEDALGEGHPNPSIALRGVGK